MERRWKGCRLSFPPLFLFTLETFEQELGTLAKSPEQYHHMTIEEVEKRYPLLVSACQYVAILSSSEAACAIRDYRDGRAAINGIHPYHEQGYGIPQNFDLKEWGERLMVGGSEAVAHYGGCRKVIQNAFAHRGMMRAARPEFYDARRKTRKTAKFHGSSD